MKNYDDLMVLLASSTFTDEHIGRAISESELNNLEALKVHYVNEINRVKEMIKAMPEFNSWSLEEKVSFAANAIAYFAIQNGQDNVITVENEVVGFAR